MIGYRPIDKIVFLKQMKTEQQEPGKHHPVSLMSGVKLQASSFELDDNWIGMP